MESKNSKLIVYGSSYDRGLEHLLKMWSDIKKEVPEAQLHVFYGWNLFDVGYRDNPERMAWKEKINELMKQDGITHLGRISHGAVLKEMEVAGIWSYPTHFGEINCITAMKAQAMGAVPVVVNYAALKETVQYGIKVEGDIYDQETKDEFKKQLITLLKDEKRQEEIRKEMMPWAQEKFKWEHVAKQWNEEFKKPSEPIYPIEKQVEELMENNQALKAWDLVKDTKLPIRERVWLRVKHAFDDKAYKDYYSRDLTEIPVSEDVALDCTKLAPRFAWVVPKLEKLNPYSAHRKPTLLDLGSADGYLGLTMANKGFSTVGVNLFKTSIDLATERAKKMKLSHVATFYVSDIFDWTMGPYDFVTILEVLEHLPDPQKGVDHAMSLLNERGTAFFSTPGPNHVGISQHKAEPNHQSWDDGKPSGHLRIFTEEEFKNLFKKYKLIDFHIDEEGCMIGEVKNV